jgi:cholesterol oxidase
MRCDGLAKLSRPGFEGARRKETDFVLNGRQILAHCVRASEERMKKLFEVDEAKALMMEATDWSLLFDFDFIVIGSGFGGSVSAHRLVEKGYKVAVMEMGRRWTPDNLPRTSWSIHRWFWRPNSACAASSTCGFSGTPPSSMAARWVADPSPTPAPCFRLPRKCGKRDRGADLADWKAEMPRHYETASRMLGVTENKNPRTRRPSAEESCGSRGSGHTFYCTKVGIFQPAEGEPGNQTFPDPFFGGEGPARTTCIGCGGCMMGCRYGAKNTLDLGYLYLAEKHGAQVFPETRVVNVRPLDGSGSERWQRRIRSLAP